MVAAGAVVAATGWAAARHNDPLPGGVPPPGGGPTPLPAEVGTTVVVQGSGYLSTVAVATVADGILLLLQGIGSGGGGPGPRPGPGGPGGPGPGGPAMSVTVEEFIGCHVINMGCFFLWVSECLTILSSRMKPLPQTSQAKGFSPVCKHICLLRSVLWLNCLGHTSHL